MTKGGRRDKHEVIYQTVVNGKFDVPLDDTADEIEVFEEANDPADNDALEVQIRSKSILRLLDLDGHPDRDNRYKIERELTPDTNSSVFLVTDVNLNRTITVKVAMNNHGDKLDNAHRLIHEALIVSYFDHPGIPPIYDLQVSDNQQIYCSMKHVNGVPLSSIIDKDFDQGEGAYIEKFDTIGKITQIFIKICETLAYAHQHSVIHRNIKPEKIVIGKHGEVYIVGWDAALDLEHDEAEFDQLCGTPLYMSPEQALCESMDYRSDVYSIGASLFHVLFKFPHLQRDEFDDFWQAKLDGAVDDLSEEQARLIPTSLLRICLKCLEKNPDDRYQGIDALLDDLRDFQEGESQVSSRSRVGVLLLAMLLLGCIVTLSVLSYGTVEKGPWGKPIHAESFGANTLWEKDFEIHNGIFLHENGQLRTNNGPDFKLSYKKRITGPVAIEFDGTMLPGSEPGDLSIFYTPDIHASKRGRKPQVYYLQNGAYGNEGSTIATPDGRLDFAPFQLQHGVTYKIRGEIDGKKVRLYVDGQLLCSYDLIFPLNSGYIGIYAYYDDKIIDNIRIYNKAQTQRTVAMQVADGLLEGELYASALERYESIADEAKDAVLVQEMNYKIGLCYYKLGRVQQAYECWDAVTDKEYASAINFFKWEELSNQGAYEELLREMYYKHRTPDKLVQKNIRHQWSILLKQVQHGGDEALIREFINFREVNFPESRLYSGNILSALMVIGESGRAIDMFPKQRSIVATALLEMGQYERIVKEYPNMRYHAAGALKWSGQYQRVIDDYYDIKEFVFESRLALGQLDKLEEEFADHPNYMSRLKVLRGERVDSGNFRNSELGVFSKSLETVLSEYFAGEAQLPQVEAVLDTAYGSLNRSVARCIQIHLLKDILHHFEGRPQGLRETLDRIYKEKRQMMGLRLWYGVGVILGKIDESGFMAQPRKDASKGDFLLYKALREDLYGDKTQALKAYQAYLNTESYERYATGSSMIFVRGRIAVLKK